MEPIKEQERIARLQRRLDHLNERIATDGRLKLSDSRSSHDRAEASALTWVIALAELALSNWPSGVQAVRGMENDR